MASANVMGITKWANGFGECRRALELLAASAADGCTEAVMLAHGFDMLVELINAGLATARSERILVGGYQEERILVRITEEGRRTLGGIATSQLIAGGEKST